MHLDHDKDDDDNLKAVGSADLELGGDAVKKIVDDVEPLVEHLKHE